MCLSFSLRNGSALGDNALPSLLQFADDLEVGDRAGREVRYMRPSENGGKVVGKGAIIS